MDFKYERDEAGCRFFYPQQDMENRWIDGKAQD